MENNNSIIQINTSIARIEKQISIGDKILALSEQSFIMLLNTKNYIKFLTVSDYQKVIESITLNKKIENKFIENIFNLNLITKKSTIIFFTQFGKYYSFNFHKLIKIQNLNEILVLENNDKIIDIINYENVDDCKSLIFVTKEGFVKKSEFKLFTDKKTITGISIKLKENDFCVNVEKIKNENEVVIASKNGKLIRFNENKTRSLSRNTFGEIGMKLEYFENNNIAIGLDIIDKFDKYILVISEKGNLKKTEIDDYRITNRGGKGVKTLSITKRTGLLQHIYCVQDKSCYLLITNLNNIVKFSISDLKIYGRGTEGEKIIKLLANEQIIKIIELPNII